MATCIDIDGVSTWTETRGSGERTLVLLHGGLGNSDDLLDSIGAADLVESFRVVAFDRRGHGYTADTDEPFHYDDMATHAIAVLERLGVASKVHLVGWSDGGIVAMLVALRRPDLVDRLVLIGVNFHVDGIHELDLGDEAPPQGCSRRYATRSPDGADHFPVVVGEVHGHGHHRADADAPTTSLASRIRRWCSSATTTSCGSITPSRSTRRFRPVGSASCPAPRTRS